MNILHYTQNNHKTKSILHYNISTLLLYKNIQSRISVGTKDEFRNSINKIKDTTTTFTQWSQNKNIFFKKLKITTYDDIENERGLEAIEKISKDEVIIRMPRKSIIAVEPKNKAPEFCPKESYWKDQPWFIRLALKLLYEKNKYKESEYYEYISILPLKINIPLLWKIEDISKLQYPYMTYMIDYQKLEYMKYYNMLSKDNINFDISSDDYQWALFCVRSRSFSGPYVGSTLQERIFTSVILMAIGIINFTLGLSTIETTLNAVIAVIIFNILYEYFLSNNLKVYLMAPMVDMMNHSCEVKSDLSYDFFRDDYIVVSSGDVEKGDQVMMNYGNQSNDTLLQFYGFVEEDNPNDVYVFFDICKKLNEILNIYNHEFDEYIKNELELEYLSINKNGEIKEIGNLNKLMQSKWLSGTKMTINTLIKKLIKLEKMKYHQTTLEEDIKELQRHMNNGKDKKDVMIVKFRIEKKKILEQVLNN